MNLRLISGNANPGLAQGISDFLGIPLVDAEIRRFLDGECFCSIKENIRGGDVFVIQSTSPPVNDNLMELLVIVDALKRASAMRITAVLPYYGYARQDRKVQPRVPISAKLVADLITVSGVDRVLTMDLHAGQIQGFFSIPVDNLFAIPVILEYFRELNINNVVMVSPDAGGVERARAFAKLLGNSSLAIIDKRRPGPNEAEVMHIIGDVKGKNAIILDDMIDSAGTMTKAAASLKGAGAVKVFACATHGVLSNPALERISGSVLEECIVTNTIPLRDDTKSCDKIKVLDVSKLFGEAIGRIYKNSSVSSLFDSEIK
jgi:ribose-phosphate pyrophosphokinase